MKAATKTQPRQTKANAIDRERILTEHLPTVRFVAQRIHERLARQVPLEDLVNAGVIGLIDAVDKYDPRKNTQLNTYAQFRIRGAILDSLRELDWSPRELRKKARQLDAAHRNLESHLGRTATHEELAKEMGLSMGEFQQLVGDLRGLEIGNLNVIISSEDDQETDLISFVPAPAEDDPFFLCLRSEMKEVLASAVSELQEKEQQVLALYYFEELSMKEVGEVLGIGESRVSQIHTSAMSRLRVRLEQKMATKTGQKMTGAEVCDKLIQAT